MVLSATIGNNIGVGDELQNFRLAIAATAEYTAYFGGQNEALAAIENTVAELNEIFERELAIHFDLVSGTNVIFTNASTDGYTNGSTTAMITQNTSILNDVVGVSNYDIGHVFGTVSSGGSGLAGLGVVNSSTWKGRGVSLSSTPVGTNFVNLVAHEIGHQFNAGHTFNANSYGATAGNRSASTAYEPASGSTLMSYAGIAADGSGDDNLQDQEDDYFHSSSFEAIQTFLAGSGAPNSTTPTGNSIPTVSAGTDFTIPAGTSFELFATGTDADSSDTLTYTWEQLDLGPAMSLPLFDNGSSPLFRSLVPTTDSSRVFPRLDDIINNVNTAQKGEVLPTTNRDLNFRATVRDGHGGVNSDDVLLTVVDTGSSFRLTNTNSGANWTGGQLETITWDVAGTHANGINAANVAIELSTDGGYTYGVTLSSSTANDGSFTLNVPNIDVTQARLRIRALGNVFFDISDANFSINSSSSDPGVTVIESGGDMIVGENGVVGGQLIDTYTLALNTLPSGPVEISVSADAHTQVSLDGVNFATTVSISLSNTSRQTVYVRGFDDTLEEGIHLGLINHSVTSSNDPSYPVGMIINSVSVTIADDELQPLIGVDFDLDGSPPSNWTKITGVFSGGASNLIREDGATSSVDLNINTSGSAGLANTNAPVNLPSHSPSLSGLDGVRYATNSITLTWSDLTPSTEYDLYLFASEPYVQDALQTVTIVGGGTNPDPFLMNTTQIGSDLLINSGLSSTTNQLEDYAVRTTASGSGQIVITIFNTAGDYVFLSGAAIQAVAPGGTAPQAINDFYEVNEDNSLTIPSNGLLANDTDDEDDILTAQLVSGPGHGSLTLSLDGSFTYIPDPDFNGTDIFTYRANDGSFDSNTATVSITVNPTNDAPVAQSDTATTDEDAAVVISVLDNDNDIDSDPISILSVSSPDNGMAVANPDGTVSYTPNPNFHGIDTFSYTISDTSGEPNSATVTITVDPVNDLPVATDDSATVDEDTAIAISVLDNDTDIDRDTLSVQSASNPANGVTAVNGDGTITYIPRANFNGSDEFTYTISDGNGGTHTATVTVTVNAVNDAPVSIDDSYTIEEDGVLNVPALGVLANDTDEEGNTLIAVVVNSPANGSLTLNADGSFTYTPYANFAGTDTFTYKASDGTASSGEAVVVIDINPVNDAPVASDDDSTTDEDTPTTINLLANDTDQEADTLNVTLQTGPSNGNVRLNPDQTVLYTPNADFHGTDTFTYSISDGNNTDTATVNVTVLPVNDAPTTIEDATTTDEDTPVIISVLSNDSDIDGNMLSIVSTTNPSDGTVTVNLDGTITYTPALDFHGSDLFTYLISDGEVESAPATVVVTVTPLNDPPVAMDDFVSVAEDMSIDIAVLDNDFDVDGDSLNVVSASDPANGSIVVNDNGTITYTPDANFHGVETFTYSIGDGQVTSQTAAVTVNVNPQNDAPEARDDSYVADEDTELTIASNGILTNDTDIDADSLIAVLVSGPANGNLILNADGSFSYTPGANFHGMDSFTYQASDGSANSNTATVSITVNAVNDAPLALDDGFEIDEDSTLNIPTDGVLSNDSDIDGDSLTTILVDGPKHGELTFNPDGSFIYTPDRDFSGFDSFTYQANDTAANSVAATVTITVRPTNDGPLAADDATTTAEDTAVIISVLSNDTDVDTDVLSIDSVSDPTYGSVQINVDGTITYMPDLHFHGSDSFTYTVNDTAGESSTATVSVTINPVNDDPSATDDTSITDEDTAIDIVVLANDHDVDGDLLTVTSVSNANHGVVSINLDGTLRYSPYTNFHGTDTFTYTVNDGNEAEDTATVTVSIFPVNDDPVALDYVPSTNEDTAVVVSVLPGASDIEGDTITLASVSTPNNGTAVINQDGTITYSPNPNFWGADLFTYTISDGNGGTDSGRVLVSVFSVNDPPVALDDLASTNEDTPVTISVVSNDVDVDLQLLSVTSISVPDHGSVMVDAFNRITYSPEANFHGQDTFTYVIDDGNGGTASAMVVVTVDPINDVPVASDDVAETDEDSDVDILVLFNDNDIDGDSLIVQSASQPANGTVVVNLDGSITYTPEADFQGVDSFTYSISDGNSGTHAATATVTVNPVNDNPVASNDSISTDEDSPVDISVLDNDSDIDGDSLAIESTTNAAQGSIVINSNETITYIPNANFHGFDMFSYTSIDGNGGSSTATVTVTVDPVNDDPVAQDDLVSTDEDTAVDIVVLVNDEDLDGDAISVTSATMPASGIAIVNASNTITYIPDPNFSGTDSFSYSIDDGQGGIAMATVTVTVNPANDLPVATEDVAITDEDVTVIISVLENDSDIDGDSLLVSILSDPTNGSASVNPNGTVTYSPNTNFYGTDVFTYQIDDGNDGTSSNTVTITIDPQNDSPTAVDDSASTSEGMPVVIAVLANDSDIDGDIPSVFSVEDPAFGGVVLNQDGTITYTPADDFHGSDSFTYVIEDGKTGTATGTVSIHVSATQNNSIVSMSLARLDGGNTIIFPPSFEDEPVVLHEWQTVGGHLWLTVEETFDASSIDLVITIDSSAELVENPIIVEHVGANSQIDSNIENTTRTTQVTISGIDIEGSQVGDHVYLGTLAFAPNVANSAGLMPGSVGEYAQTTSDLGFSVIAAETVDMLPLAHDSEVLGSMAPIVYDASNDGRVGLADFAGFIRHYGDVADENQPEAYRYDFDRSGKVSLQDFALFIRYYGRRKASETVIEMPGLTSDLASTASRSITPAALSNSGQTRLIEPEPIEITWIDPELESLSQPIMVTHSSFPYYQVNGKSTDQSSDTVDVSSVTFDQGTIRREDRVHTRHYSNFAWEPRVIDHAVQDIDIFDFPDRIVELEDEAELAFTLPWNLDED